jgi:hypothetical protein
MTEATLTKKTTDACAKLMVGCVILKHADKASAGHPDTSITWHGNTLWVEFKHANPSFKSQGIQELTCSRLALHGLCVYVVFDSPRDRICILAPKELGKWPHAVVSCSGFSFEWLAEQLYLRLLR